MAKSKYDRVASGSYGIYKKRPTRKWGSVVLSLVIGIIIIASMID